MTANSRKTPAPPLGVIGALAAGFEAVNARLELTLPPLALDLFLWLGPRLSVRPLVAGWLGLLTPSSATDEATRQNLQQLRDMLSMYGEQYNLFSLLSTAPMGVPSLNAARLPVQAPGGPLSIWPVDNPFLYLTLVGGLLLAGLFLGALYLGGIAQQVRDGRLDPARLLRQVWGDWLRLTALAGLVLGLVLVLGGPVLLFAVIATLLNPVIGALISLAGTALVMLALFYISFALPGILLGRRGLLRGVWDSLRLVHFSLPATSLLYLTVSVIGLGLGALWNLPADDSWLLLVSVGGHALVSTALMAAVFAFYQDRYRWWQELQARPAAPVRLGGVTHDG